MKGMILTVFVALAVVAGIASLADAATILINATAHPGPYDNTVGGVGGCSAGSFGGA